MTAEVVLMNKQAVALAADSAGTVGEKISNSNNKLFTLSKWQPIGIMVYDSAEIMGYPWETIIKMYRRHLGKKKFGKLHGYVGDFLNYLRKFKFDAQTEKLYIESVIEKIVMIIYEEMSEQFPEPRETSKPLLIKYFEKVISEIKKYLKDNTSEQELIICSFSDSDKKNILAKYKKKSIDLISEHLKEYRIDNQKVYNSIYPIIKNCIFNGSIFEKSGLVFSGFGVSEIFPATEKFVVYSVINSEIMMNKPLYREVNLENSAVIMPFAQREMVNTFVEGIDPFLFDEIKAQVYNMLKEFTVVQKSFKKNKTLLKNALDKSSNKFYQSFLDDMHKYIRIKHELPIIDGVSNLSPSELASMAETLISLTSFKRKISANYTETVGGPVDVAVITKGDGFIWIKRKLYFDANINRYFFSNYLNEDEENKKRISFNKEKNP